jgi:hypothetical protein
VAALQGRSGKGRLGLQGTLFIEKDSMGRPSIIGGGDVATLDASPYRRGTRQGRQRLPWVVGGLGAEIEWDGLLSSSPLFF